MNILRQIASILYHNKYLEYKIKGYLLGVPVYKKTTNRFYIRKSFARIAYSFKRTYKYCYHGGFEKARLRRFYQGFSTPEFPEKFRLLTEGLDTRSKFTVSRIINRIREVQELPVKGKDVYTVQEQKLLSDLNDEFYANIVDLAEKLFCYGEYYLPVRHFEPSVFFYKHGLAHVQNPEKLKDKDILDIGGFIGDSVLVLSPYTNRTVYSFEAVAGQRQLMQKTLELNKIKNAKIVPLALGSRKESVEIVVNGSSSCISKDNFARAVREKVDMDTLDNYVVQNGIQVGLIKVDIEGFEQEFLKGAVNTIKTQKPVLVLSIYHNWSDFFDIKPMIESWNLGYKFKIVKPIDGAILAETLLIAEVR